jgi:hypothetical protein
MTVESLEKLIDETKPVYGNTVCLPVAELWSIITKKELVNWLSKNRERAWVEGSSNPVMRNVWRGKLRLLLKVNGRYFSFLFCQRRTDERNS